MRRWILLLPLSVWLAGCGVVSGAASVAGSAIGTAGSVVGTAVETTVDVATAPVR